MFETFDLKVPESVKNARIDAEFYGGELHWQEVGIDAFSDYILWRSEWEGLIGYDPRLIASNFDVLSAMGFFERWLRDSGDSELPITAEEMECYAKH